MNWAGGRGQAPRGGRSVIPSTQKVPLLVNWAGGRGQAPRGGRSVIPSTQKVPLPVNWAGGRGQAHRGGQTRTLEEERSLRTWETSRCPLLDSMVLSTPDSISNLWYSLHQTVLVFGDTSRLKCCSPHIQQQVAASLIHV